MASSCCYRLDRFLHPMAKVVPLHLDHMGRLECVVINGCDGRKGLSYFGAHHSAEVFGEVGDSQPRVVFGKDGWGRLHNILADPLTMLAAARPYRFAASMVIIGPVTPWPLTRSVCSV